MLTRARRDGHIEVAWDSTADRACETLAKKGWLKENREKNQYFSTPATVYYEITEEGKRG
ncbi:MAG TPA: hypothetical protein VIG47_08080 [Gemmatimonadaceae bacterium]